MAVGWVKTTVLFSPFVDQFTEKVSRRGRDRSLQRRFPIFDILFHSRDIRNRSAKSSEIAPKILDTVFKTAPISDHVAKFHGDRPRDRGDLAMKKKKTAAKYKGSHVALSQRGGPKMLQCFCTDREICQCSGFNFQAS